MRSYYTIHTIWLAIMLLTVGVYFAGESSMHSLPLMFFLFVTTMIKGSLIIREFMALKGVSLLWRVIMYGWLWTVCLVIAVIYGVGG